MGLRSRRRRPDDTTTVALAGAGAIAVVHALAAPEADCRVVAVASAGGRSARHLAGQLDEQHSHGVRHVSVSALPAGADLVVVASPPDSHADLALAGLGAGADVLLEKPFTTTLADADRLVAAASGPDAPVLRVAENLLHAPVWRRAVAHRSGMGPLGHLSAVTRSTPPTWGHFRRPLTAGGVLFDLGPHPLALVMDLAAGPVVGVTARLSSTREDSADDDAVVRLRFASGLVATVDVSWTADDTEWAVQAASEGGVVRLELYPEVALELDGDPVVVPPRHPSAVDPRLEQMGYIDQLRDTVATALGSTDRPGQTPEAAREVLEVICAAYASAGAGGEEVAVPNDLDRTLTPMQLWRNPNSGRLAPNIGVK